MTRFFKVLAGFTLALIPLSFPLSLPGGVVLNFPSECLLVLLGVGVAVALFQGKLPEKEKLRHPITLLLLLDLLITFLSALNSEIPLVSFKRLAVKTLYLGVFYIGMLRVFSDRQMITKYFSAVLTGLMAVVVWATLRHFSYGPEVRFAPAMPRPFFSDHTIYGAVIAFFLPLVWAKMQEKKISLKNPLLLGVVVLLFMGLILSFSRGAWLSVLFAGVVWGLLQGTFSRKGVWVLFPVLWLFLAGTLFYTGKTAYVFENVSNQEHLNRWHTAWRLFEMRPLLGWGPGTYQHVYGPYQQPKEMTRISTYRGDGGNAHSEYLGPLAETGLAGGILPLLLVIFIVKTGVSKIGKRPQETPLFTGIFLALLTFWFHGLMNGFLDQDKMAVLVYGGMAALVQLQKKPE
ncbi:MAG: O-antigen ligase family protein [Bacteroidia bacterium]|nr:O-antigen ligase family protein [Bacteroidia bacterium]